jgi:hypothetical protein
MAYAGGNPKTKKQLKEWISSGKRVGIFSSGPFGCTMNGTDTIEGPQYPAPHKWYARVEVVNGYITKVLG